MSVEKKVQPANRSNNLTENLNWSLRHLTRWLIFLGVLGVGSRPAIIQCCRIFLLCFVLTIHFWLMTDTILNAQRVLTSYSDNTTSAMTWNFTIDSINLSLYTITGHVILLLITRAKTWSNIIDSLTKLSENMDNFEIYSKCRRVSFYFIVYIIILVC